MANNIVVNNAKRAQLLTEDVQTYLETLEWRLYTNNVTPNPALTNSQFTEVTDSGYLPQTTTFSAPVLNGSNQGQTVGDVIENVLGHSGGDYTIYGSFATDPGDSDTWVIAGKAASALPVTASGQIAQIAPTVLLDQMP